MSKNIWFVVANSSSARILGKKKGNHKLHLIKEFEHPESRKKASELISDHAGHYRTANLGSGNFSSRTDPKKVEADHFAHELAQFLDHSRTQNDFDSLVLVMPPAFQSLVKHHSSQPLLQTIKETISKDYHEATEKELQENLSFIHFQS